MVPGLQMSCVFLRRFNDDLRFFTVIIRKRNFPAVIYMKRASLREDWNSAGVVIVVILSS